VTARRSSEAGFTFIEVMLAMGLMLIVFAATLTIFTTVERGHRDNQALNDSQMQARQATDTLARKLRNLASPSNGSTAADQQPLERAQPQDLVFRTVRADGAPTASNPQNLERYRYCLGTDEVLYEQRQTWTGTLPGVPAGAACPGAGYTETRRIAQHVVNAGRPVFHYQGSPVPGTYSELTAVNPADFPTAIALRSTIYVDPDVNHRPGAATLTTRVFLRNQNRPPLPEFSMTASANKLTLNGSASSDPEGKPLEYQWFDNGVAIKDSKGVTIPRSANAVLTFKAASGAHSIELEITDVGNLSARSGAKTATCTTTACTVIP
jgi:type II secretory pathway component PulJ